MSVIAAVRKGSQIVIASDTQDNFGDLRPPAENHYALKLREVAGAIVGSSGWALYDDILGHYASKSKTLRLHSRVEIFEFFLKFWKTLHRTYPFVNDQSGKDGNDSPFATLDSTFLVASPRGIFLVSPNMSVSEFHQYYAIGSGGDYAIGAMHALYDDVDSPKILAERAVRAAMAYDVYCGGRIESRSIKVTAK